MLFCAQIKSQSRPRSREGQRRPKLKGTGEARTRLAAVRRGLREGKGAAGGGQSGAMKGFALSCTDAYKMMLCEVQVTGTWNVGWRKTLK